MASAIRFVGNYDVTSEGKFLWEILCQLRKLGVGRIVTKNQWIQKWPDQPSYMRVVRAQPAMDPWLFGGKVWAEWIFRGRSLGVYEFSKDLNRSDWRLIHKHEEKDFTVCKAPMKEVVFPDSYPLPPLQAHFARRNAEKNNQQIDEKSLRAPLQLCVDPEFEMLRQFIKQEPVAKAGKSVYDEVDPQTILDLYGQYLPLKVEPWNAGPAKFTPRFSASTMKVQEQSK